MSALLNDPRLPIDFWNNIEVRPSGCWHWIGSIKRSGYARFRSSDSAHRVSYSILVGPIPEGLQIDHLCRNRACVNPDHLEPVTQQENMRRGIQAQQTHCKNGHEYSPENTYLRPPSSGGRRDCRACIRDRARRYIAKRRAA